MKKISLFLIFFGLINFTYSQEINSAIQVEVVGQGEPLLFIPGFTVPGEVWNPTVEKLAGKYECHIVTLAGFGGTDPIGFPWLPQVNEDLKNYILSNNLKGTKIIGHSLGGTIAIWLASQNELPISELVLVDALPASGALMFPDFNPENLSYDNPFSEQQLEMSQEAFDQMATAMSQGMSLKKSEQEKIKKWMVDADRKTYVYGYTDYLKLDMREDLKEIEIPVTIIAADQPYGREKASETIEAQFANLQDYQLIFANSAGHFVMLDQPEWFIEKLESLLLPNQ